ncbi:hypothetical protein I0C86_28635 [Plantactinospora sp. S1510]|uniref:Nuclear transport factor 2 family protein n=1 Tax=Plantactinospora alkalitolerans TaxID=2789879 RepID=A0ABS0H359_9ACTN|nr:hypothetical protein [Plantactinospora alkalitolerans]MBF9132895.1 hypothetical protein [Plantactinospora alkalitolerans]
MPGIDPKTLTDRYVAVWSEPDPERRRDGLGFDRLVLEMVPRDGGDVTRVGLEILVLGADGRIASDYQFIEG